MSEQQTTAPPGWYPVDGEQERWWNGQAWDDELRPAAAAKVPRAPGPKVPLWFVFVAAGGAAVLFLLIGLGAAGAARFGASAGDDEAAALRAENSRLQGLVDDIEDREDAVAGREAEVQAREDDVATREAAADKVDAEAAANTFPGSGTFLVGTDIKPGTYRSTGNDGCYWARLSGVSGAGEEIIANEIVSGQGVVKILASDVAFETSGCGDWTKVG